METCFGHNPNIYRLIKRYPDKVNLGFSPVVTKGTSFVRATPETSKMHSVNTVIKKTFHFVANEWSWSDQLSSRITSDWMGFGVSGSLLYTMRGEGFMDNLPFEQKILVDKFKQETKTKSLYYFQQSETANIWVIVPQADVDTEYEYAKIYVDTVRKYPNLDCDYMILSEAQLLCMDIPSNVIIETVR